MKSQILPEENLIIIRMGQASLCNNCGCRAVDESKFVNHDDKIPAASFCPVRRAAACWVRVYTKSGERFYFF